MLVSIFFCAQQAMYRVIVLALVWMILFHFYVEHKFDRLRSDLIRISQGHVGGVTHPNVAASSNVIVPPFHVQQMKPAQPHYGSLLPTVADIAAAPANAPPGGALLPAYEDAADIYMPFGASGALQNAGGHM